MNERRTNTVISDAGCRALSVPQVAAELGVSTTLVWQEIKGAGSGQSDLENGFSSSGWNWKRTSARPRCSDGRRRAAVVREPGRGRQAPRYFPVENVRTDTRRDDTEPQVRGLD